MGNSGHKYDEAKSILRATRDKMRPKPEGPDLGDYRKAAKTILSDLLSLNGYAKIFTFRMEKPPPGVEHLRIHLLGTEAYEDVGIRYNNDDPCSFSLFSFDEAGPISSNIEKIPFVYNDDEKTIESTDPDTFCEPIPGQLKRKRSPLAVLIEKAIERIQKGVPEHP